MCPSVVAVDDASHPRPHPLAATARLVQQSSGINRLRAMPQRPGVLASWHDNKQVRIIDVTQQLEELAAEEVIPTTKPQKVQVGARGAVRVCA